MESQSRPIFLLSCVLTVSCLMVTRAADSTAPSDEPSSPASSKPGGDVTKPSEVSSVAPPKETNELGGYTLYDDAQTICYRAEFTAKVVVRYRTKNTDNTQLLEKTLMPANTTTSGTCDANEVAFKMAWANGNYTLSMRFNQTSQINKVTSTKISTWFAAKIGFVLDATDNPDFPGIAKKQIFETVSPSKDVHFEAPSNLSYACTTQEDIALNVLKNGSVDTSVIESVMLSLWDVKMQAFEVPKTGKFSDSAQCKPDMERSPGQNMAPLVVASCLAVLIGIIIIAYYFIKNRQSTQYSSME